VAKILTGSEHILFHHHKKENWNDRGEPDNQLA